MNDKQISAFISVAELGSFSQAARKQYISPQAITQQIDLLENELGIKLFIRSRKGITLSKPGELFYHWAIKLSQSYSDLLYQLRSLDNSEKQTLHIGLFDTIMMDTLCKAFSSEFPHIKQEYTMISTDAWIDVLHQLSNGQLDIIEHADCPEVHQNGFVFEPLHDTGTFCALPSSHPLSIKKEILLSDLRGMLVGIHSRTCVLGLEDLLAQQAPGAVLIDGEKSTLSAFDICAKGGAFLFPDVSHKRFVPLQIIPLKCDLVWRFGIVHKENPNENVRLFVDMAKRIYKKV